MYSFPSWKSAGQMCICRLLLAFMCFLLQSMQLYLADRQFDCGSGAFSPLLYKTGGEPQDHMHTSKYSTTEHPSSLFRDSLSCSGRSSTHSVAQADFGLKSFLPHPPEYLGVSTCLHTQFTGSTLRPCISEFKSLTIMKNKYF